MARSAKAKQFDKLYLASKPGKRTSKKWSTILKVDGTKFKRRNANQEGDAEGGKTYTENRVNRTDKRFAGLRMAEKGMQTAKGKALDKNLLASAPGKRTSKKWATILKKDGTKFKRRNANQEGDAEGGKKYYENRVNRTDKNFVGLKMAKKGANIQSARGKALDKNLLATTPGKRTSKKFAKILKKDGTAFRRRNANQFGEADGNKKYYENRVNRTDKNFVGLKMAEEGANIGGFSYSIGGL